ncbi:hypothetical protein B0H16DRAFT_1456238 [Mycena metata]|uniref:Uncharacterized protein n=1 Tax=Mycena metata TaxID=1033252 RepID=A0AAD7JES3_9AGAR|nr:hypothetical protein B0H16DRAFT_1456238 [Mycena metata]
MTTTLTPESHFPQAEIDSVNEHFDVITPKETKQLRELYNEMLDEGHDQTELRQVIINHVRYMEMMYMLSKRVFEGAAKVGINVPDGIMDDDEEMDALVLPNRGGPGPLYTTFCRRC